MSNNCKKKCSKFNQGCNKKHDNDCCECSKFQQISREKCEQAKDCLEASVQCFKECHKEECGCSSNDWEWKIECKDDKHICDHSCKCNHNW